MVAILSLTCLSMISVEKMILTLTNFFISFFLKFFRENSEIQDGCQRHMTTHPFHKKIQKGFFISYLCYASEKSMIKPHLNLQQKCITAWVSDLVKFPEKGLGTVAAIWPSTERVNFYHLPMFR
jgi:hypothetical protein